MPKRTMISIASRRNRELSLQSDHKVPAQLQLFNLDITAPSHGAGVTRYGSCSAHASSKVQSTSFLSRYSMTSSGSVIRAPHRWRPHCHPTPTTQTFYPPIRYVRRILPNRIERFPDLHLLLNTLASSTTLQTSESWLPICFPKFNPAGFVHAYVSYVLEDVGLVFVSADREAFEELQSWKHIVLEVGHTMSTCYKLTGTEIGEGQNAT